VRICAGKQDYALNVRVLLAQDEYYCSVGAVTGVPERCHETIAVLVYSALHFFSPCSPHLATAIPSLPLS